MKQFPLRVVAASLVCLLGMNAHAWAKDATPAKKPNILIIMSDDVGPFNISAYNHGMLGYRTPKSGPMGGADQKRSRS